MADKRQNQRPIVPIAAVICFFVLGAIFFVVAEKPQYNWWGSSTGFYCKFSGGICLCLGGVLGFWQILRANKSTIIANITTGILLLVAGVIALPVCIWKIVTTNRAIKLLGNSATAWSLNAQQVRPATAVLILGVISIIIGISMLVVGKKSKKTIQSAEKEYTPKEDKQASIPYTPTKEKSEASESAKKVIRAEPVKRIAQVEAPPRQKEKSEKPNVLFCRKCGAKIPADSAFCMECGEKVVRI